MASIFGNAVKNNTDIDDEVIANSMLASAKGAANAYLNASLVCFTPELRAMYSAGLSQVLAGHAALADLAVKRGWEDPYVSPSQQLSSTYNKARDTVETKRH